MIAQLRIVIEFFKLFILEPQKRFKSTKFISFDRAEYMLYYKRRVQKHVVPDRKGTTCFNLRYNSAGDTPLTRVF